MKMNETEKIEALHEYLNTALENDVLLETVHTAFKLQQTKGYDMDKAFHEALWSWLVFLSKTTDRERVKDTDDLPQL
tara:strand:- start:989 stop:1219 length:231 start_codon:yes stop_codon:yes gene_type:complete